jgi:hypothetical protein
VFDHVDHERHVVLRVEWPVFVEAVDRGGPRRADDLAVRLPGSEPGQRRDVGVDAVDDRSGQVLGEQEAVRAVAAPDVEDAVGFTAQNRVEDGDDLAVPRTRD